jgi:sensor histidine kinase YesM
MKKSLTITLNFGFWTCFLLLIITILTAATFQESTSTPSLQYLIKLSFGFILTPALVAFYLCYLLLFPKYIKHKKTLLTITYGLLISIVAALAGGLVLSLTFGSSFMFKDNYSSFFGEIILMSFIAFICGIIGFIIKGFICWYEELKVKEALVIKNQKLKLALVKTKLDPHFLFNTINNIDVLILKSPENGSNYLNKLSDILRFMLFETEDEFISLTKEIEYIKKYIDLQKIRTSNSNYVNLKIEGSTEGIKIAPMILISYIENAFKHATNKKINNAITIRIKINNDQINFKCQNKSKLNKINIQKNNSIGNSLLRSRLDLIYKHLYTLEVTNENELYSVSLILKNKNV